MYPVNPRFHELIVADAPKTRARIYFIPDTVDCTDDNDVRANGTLLVGQAGDTDSNARIASKGIEWPDYFNPTKNAEIGLVSSTQIGMTLLNTDGALNNFAYGRCKVYLDVYDADNATWLPCPMGVYNIEQPLKRRTQLVSVVGFDQVGRLDQIADTWWASINWASGITMLDLINSMATAIGASVSTGTASAVLNASVTYTEPPFECVEVTYREILEEIAEATGTNARFDRDGALDLRWFAPAEIGGNTVHIDADTIGNTVFDIDAAEYQAAQIDALNVKIASDNTEVTVGTGTNRYSIVDNLFLSGTVSEMTQRATPIYNRLNGLGAYNPAQVRCIADPSIEAGDIIEVEYQSNTYTLPILQQSITWRGGFATSVLLADGDNTRPVLDYVERSSYRRNVELRGYVTFTNLSTPGQTSIDGGNIYGGTLTLGGNNNGNGVLRVLDASGTQIAAINNDGIALDRGDISIPYSTADYVGTGTVKINGTDAFRIEGITSGNRQYTAQLGHTGMLNIRIGDPLIWSGAFGYSGMLIIKEEGNPDTLNVPTINMQDLSDATGKYIARLYPDRIWIRSITAQKDLLISDANGNLSIAGSMQVGSTAITGSQMSDLLALLTQSTATLTPAKTGVTITAQSAVTHAGAASVYIVFTVASHIDLSDLSPIITGLPAPITPVLAVAYDQTGNMVTDHLFYVDSGTNGLKCSGSIDAGTYTVFVTYTTA